MEQKKSTGRAILSAVISFIVWELIGLLYSLFTAIVVFGYISAADSLRDGAVIFLLIFAAITVALLYGEYRLCLYLIPKIAKNTPTTALAYKIFGWVLIAANIINIISSISDGSKIQVLGIYIGYCFIRKAKKLSNPAQTEDKENGAFANATPTSKIEQPKKAENDLSRMPFSKEYYSKASAAMNLANATINLVQSQRNMNAAKFIFCNDVAVADVVFFSCFALRAVCIGSTSNRTAATQFSDAFISYIIKMTGDTFLQEDTVQEMFDNRTSFYDNIVIENGGLSDGIPKILQQFAFIVQTDMIEKKYVPFSSGSPIPLIDFFDAMQCSEEINSYINLLFSKTENEVKQVIDSIQ